jgi:hypothetical protein
MPDGLVAGRGVGEDDGITYNVSGATISRLNI